MVQLRLKPAHGVGDADIRAVLGPDWRGQSGLEVGPHGRWLIFRITGSDRIDVAEALAVSALASGLVEDAEITTVGTGSRTTIHTRKVASS